MLVDFKYFIPLLFVKNKSIGNPIRHINRLQLLVKNKYEKQPFTFKVVHNLLFNQHKYIFTRLITHDY